MFTKEMERCAKERRVQNTASTAWHFGCAKLHLGVQYLKLLATFINSSSSRVARAKHLKQCLNWLRNPVILLAIPIKHQRGCCLYVPGTNTCIINDAIQCHADNRPGKILCPGCGKYPNALYTYCIISSERFLSTHFKLLKILHLPFPHLEELDTPLSVLRCTL